MIDLDGIRKRQLWLEASDLAHYRDSCDLIDYVDALRALLVRGIAFAANCDADPEQPEGFREKARAWREEVNTVRERTP